MPAESDRWVGYFFCPFCWQPGWNEGLGSFNSMEKRSGKLENKESKTEAQKAKEQIIKLNKMTKEITCAQTPSLIIFFNITKLSLDL